jgi:branched-chain amino acid transport system permease protein
MNSDIFLQASVNGVLLSLLLVLFSLGLSLVFGIMRIINLAHGEIYMLGGFGIWVFFAKYHLNYFLALGLSMLAVAVIGMLIERFILKPFRGRLFAGLIASVGLILVLQCSASLGFGFTDKAVPAPPGLSGVVSVLGISISRERLSFIVIAAVLVLLLHLFLQRTKPGKAMRATAQEPGGAALMGIKVDRTCSLAMGLGSALAAAAGSLTASMFYVNPFIGAPWLMKGLAAIVLGGLGSIPGTVAGGFILGMLESYGATYIGADFALTLFFLVLLVVLIIRPRGLFGLPIQ